MTEETLFSKSSSRKLNLVDSFSPKNRYWLTRFVFLRLLGLVYFFAFLVAANQLVPLIGEDGLLPADSYLERLRELHGSRLSAFWRNPTLFWFGMSDPLLSFFSWTGVVLSFVVVLGFANSILMAVLWFLYLSIVHVGQMWYGYGWEIQLLETGFLAIFICPLVDLRPFPKNPPPVLVIYLLRWLIFRIMLGSGLIKIRGDPCWRDLTCLYYHYETQPIPNPLSRWFHFMPNGIHRIGVLLNHWVELAAPFLAFGPRTGRVVAGSSFVLFQVVLMLSGNLSFLNWLTLCPAMACFDDGFLRRLLPKKLVWKADRAAIGGRWSRGQRWISVALALFVGVLSIAPVANLLSSNQAMNTSFDQFHLVNTYGAFGSVGKKRYEIILEGATGSEPGPETVWKEYEFKAKPGDPKKSPPFLSPYHYRVDWQIWFAAMSTPRRHPWMIHLMWKLLHNEPGALSLIAYNPFPDAPPDFIRAELYLYEFSSIGNPAGTVWKRELIGSWLPPLSRRDERLVDFLEAMGWVEPGAIHRRVDPN